MTAPLPQLAEESTLDSSSQPTNFPTSYVSVRLTLAHDKWPKIKRLLLHDVPSYIAYPHSADSGTKKEHWHIAIPTDTRKDMEKFRKRIRDKLELSGNEYISAKYCVNGIQSFVTYAAKEGTLPKVTDDLVRCVSTAPKWVQKTLPSVAPPDVRKDRDWQLTYSNLVTQAVHHHRSAGLATSSTLKETFMHMVEHTKWRPSYSLLAHGVPPFYESDFERRIGRTTTLNMEWWSWHI